MKRNYCLLILPCLLCCCSSKNVNVEISEHQLVLEPMQSHKFEVKLDTKKSALINVENEDILQLDKETYTVIGLREGRTSFSVFQKPNNLDSCDVAVRYPHIAPTNLLNIATIAHKGYHVNAIENTFEAFSEAGRRNFFGIETDIHKTLDDKWVCNHDNRVKGMDKNISDCTLKEIMAVNLSDDPNKVVRVCTFEEYLDICSAYNKHPVIEFKESTTQQYIESVIEILTFHRVLDEVIFISKLGDVLGTLLNLKNKNDYKYELQMLVEGNGWQHVSEYLNVSSQYEAITSGMVEDCNSINQYVAAWTVNDRDVANSLIDMGVKYITTDIFECMDQFIDNSLFGI